MKAITKDNYRDFKPSEFVHSFISDIEVAERAGKKMDMTAWIKSSAKPGCLPCLGGLACMNMSVAILDDIGTHVSNAGDEIRLGCGIELSQSLGYLYPDREIDTLTEFYEIFKGVMGKKDLAPLKERILYYVRELEAQGN